MQVAFRVCPSNPVHLFQLTRSSFDHRLELTRSGRSTAPSAKRSLDLGHLRSLPGDGRLEGLGVKPIPTGPLFLRGIHILSRWSVSTLESNDATAFTRGRWVKVQSLVPVKPEA